MYTHTPTYTVFSLNPSGGRIESVSRLMFFILALSSTLSCILFSLGSRDSSFSRSGGLGTAVVGETSRRVHLSGFFKGPFCQTSILLSSSQLFMNMSIMVFFLRITCGGLSVTFCMIDQSMMNYQSPLTLYPCDGDGKLFNFFFPHV